MQLWLPVYLLLLIAIGYLLPQTSPRNVSRLLAWAIALMTLAFSFVITLPEIPLIRMPVIVAMQLVSMKIIVMVECYRDGTRLSLPQWIGFSTAWFGMKPSVFEKRKATPLPFTDPLTNGLLNIILGLAVLYLSLQAEGIDSALHLLFITELLSLVAFSLILHFGILPVVTALWRIARIDAPLLFRSPSRALSLTEFWSRRWNIAYSEMTSVIAYRPLRPLIGRETALTLAFLLSGLLHEIAISLPVSSGFGLPMAYFILHAIAIRVEKTNTFSRILTRSRPLARMWVLSMLVLPLPLLFHAKFVALVLKPLRDVILKCIGFI